MNRLHPNFVVWNFVVVSSESENHKSVTDCNANGFIISYSALLSSTSKV